MPNFVWFGILGLVLLYAAGIVMFVAKQKNLVNLRRYHPLLGSVGALSLAIHAIWANLSHLGHPLPLVGWIGLIGIVGVFFGYYAISRAKKTGDRKWRQLHWQVQLGALLVATFHAVWFLVRIMGR